MAGSFALLARKLAVNCGAICEHPPATGSKAPRPVSWLVTARQMLTEWAAKQAAVSAERDTVIRQALYSGLSKIEVHRLTGVARTTVDRIIDSAQDGPATAPSEASGS